MLGLDAAGKTTILYKMSMKEKVNIVQLPCMNTYETLKYKNFEVTCLDIYHHILKREVIWQLFMRHH